MLQGSPEWLALRARHAATASEYATALGIGYRSRQKYMREKLGIDQPEEANWRMQEGNRREPWVAELYLRLMRRIGYQIELLCDGFRDDPADHRLGGSVDRIVVDQASGDRWLLEIKTCPGGDMRESIPHAHLLQMWGLCHAYGLDRAHYICSSYGQGLLLAEVTWKPGYWERDVLPRLQQFCEWWENAQMPPRMNSQEKVDLIELVYEASIITPISGIEQLQAPPQTPPNTPNL